MNRFALVALAVALVWTGSPTTGQKHHQMIDNAASHMSDCSQGDDCHSKKSQHSGHDSQSPDCQGCDMSVSCCPSGAATMVDSNCGLTNLATCQIVLEDLQILYISSLAFLIDHPPKLRS